MLRPVPSDESPCLRFASAIFFFFFRFWALVFHLPFHSFAMPESWCKNFFQPFFVVKRSSSNVERTLFICSSVHIRLLLTFFCLFACFNWLVNQHNSGWLEYDVGFFPQLRSSSCCHHFPTREMDGWWGNSARWKRCWRRRQTTTSGVIT